MFFTVEKIQKQLSEIRDSVQRGIQDIPVFKYIERDIPRGRTP
jgi:hypothetical protein